MLSLLDKDQIMVLHHMLTTETTMITKTPTEMTIHKQITTNKTKEITKALMVAMIFLMMTLPR